MAAAPRRWAAELLHLWFHELAPADWFGGGASLDRLLARRFAREWTALRGQAAETFLTDPASALAGVLLFDQLPRNLHRGTPAAFASDPLARAICKGALARGFAPLLADDAQRQFLAMPLMHSESRADQLLALTIYRRLGPRHGWPFARAHAHMVLRFGRFPHRNAVLGRTGTPAEARAVAAGNAW